MLKNLISVTSVLLTISSFYSTAKANHQDIETFESTSGWTGSIRVSFRKDMNLTEYPLELTLNNESVRITSAWGLDSAEIIPRQEGKKVSFVVGKRWDGRGDMIVEKGKFLTFQFSPSHDVFTLTNPEDGLAPVRHLNPAPVIIVPPVIHHAEEAPVASSSIPQRVGRVPVAPYIDVTLNEVTKWSNAANSMQPTGLYDIVRESKVNALRLAFVTANRDTHKPTFAGYDVASGYGVDVFKTLQDQGIHLTLSFGGVANDDLAKASRSAEELAATYLEIIETYHPNALDFDIENCFERDHSDKLDIMMKAIQTIQEKYPFLKMSFTLPVLPEGLVDGNGLGVLKKAAAHKLSFSTNIMAMDYAYPCKKTMGDYAIDAVQSTFSQVKQAYIENGYAFSDAEIWSKLEVTPMIGMNDTAPENFSVVDAVKVREFAESVSLGGVCFWSLNRDHGGVGSQTNIVHSSTNPSTGQPNQRSSWEYVWAFLGQK